MRNAGAHTEFFIGGGCEYKYFTLEFKSYVNKKVSYVQQCFQMHLYT